MFRQPDALDVALSLLGILRETLDERLGPAARRCILQNGYQLVEEVRVCRCKDDLRRKLIANSGAIAE